jgi:hypothetical protein
MTVLGRLSLSVFAVMSSVVPSLAQNTHGRPHGGGGGHGVPEIDASAGIATLAVLATVGIISYARRQK